MKQIDLRFDPKTTRAFNRYYLDRYADYMRWVLLVITTLFSLSGFLDLLLASPKLSEMFILRYAVVLLLLFGINIAIFFKPLVRSLRWTDAPAKPKNIRRSTATRVATRQAQHHPHKHRDN